jgi:hypothetical protein
MTTLQESGFLTKIDTKTCCCCVISAHVRETRRSSGVLGAGLVALVRKFIRKHEKVALEDATLPWESTNPEAANRPSEARNITKLLS